MEEMTNVICKEHGFYVRDFPDREAVRLPCPHPNCKNGSPADTIRIPIPVSPYASFVTEEAALVDGAGNLIDETVFRTRNFNRERFTLEQGSCYTMIYAWRKVEKTPS
jgi:hypothetical protein